MKPRIDPQILEELWKSPQNWKWGNIYYCEADPRVIVPKHQKWMGWTINFVRPTAFPTLIALIVFISAPLTWLTFEGYVNTPLWFAVLVADIVAVCLACWHLTSKRRY